MLRPQHRTKLNPDDDRLFYDFPRFVTHVDPGFIEQLTDLYRQKLKPQMRVFDMMSSWVSHLPQEMEFAYVEGHGMNEEELAGNKRLDRYFVRNLNIDLQLPLEDNSFDAVLNTVSVQYLEYPEAIFTEIHRILKPGGVAIFSFSNRMFYEKAIAIWRDSSESQRVELVKGYFTSVPGFTTPEVVSQASSAPNLFQWLGVSSGDPFYAVMAYKRSVGSGD
jgi:SAM-dependent methyltransferase